MDRVRVWFAAFVEFRVVLAAVAVVRDATCHAVVVVIALRHVCEFRRRHFATVFVRVCLVDW